MAVWDKLLKKVISPVVKKSIEELEENNKLSKRLTANSLPIDPYPDGAGSIANKVTRKIFPSGVSYQTLRDFSLLYPILRSCINYRKRQIAQLAWDIAPREVIKDKKKKESLKKEAKIVRSFLKHPTGDETMSFGIFVNKIIEDLMVLDAVSIYRRLNRKGDLYGYLPIDSTTIKLRLNKDGTVPAAPQKAYVQVIDGKVTAKLSTDELIYKLMNPRTNTPYGLSPVESLIITVTTALKLSSYNLAYLTEGNVPEGFVELPAEVADSPEQMQLWQQKWDAMFSGDPKFQRKIKFLPEGMKWHPIRKPDDMAFDRFEKWLLLNTCSVMEVPPQAIGFQFDRGKGATEAEWEIGKERGLFPTANFLKEVFDRMIQEDLEQDDLEFVWTNINPTNKKEEADVFSKLVGYGAVSVDEWRIAEGYEPIGMSHYITTPTGPVFVKDLIDMSEQGTPILPQSYLPQDGQTPPPKGNKPGAPKDSPVPPKDNNSVSNKIKKIADEDIVDELKKWKRAAKNDFKKSREFRLFDTDIIESRTKRLIKDGLRDIKKKEQLDELFDPFINQENSMLKSVLKLYDDVKDVVDENEKTKKGKKAN